MSGREAKDATCFTGGIVSEYVGLANQFTQDLSQTLLGPMWILFGAFAGLWIVIQGLRLVLHQTTGGEVAKEFMFVMIATFLLSGQGPELVNDIYSASLSMMGSAASLALMVGDHASVITANTNGAIPLESGMVALTCTAESGVINVFRMAGTMSRQSSLTDLMPSLYALVLVVPYFLVLVVYFSQVVISIFRIMMLATLSPFLMLGFGFGWGRDMMKSGIRTLISAFMVLFGATAALAVMLYGVSGIEASFTSSQDVRDFASIENPEFILAVAMGWLGTAFMTEATGMANSISGSSLTNTAAGVITAGAT
ncbi:MAG: hypothetical protein HON65_04180, partial [Rhodospirillales bacterium]|nr:hypothetical protein [Rhodospirillales bacterium]